MNAWRFILSSLRHYRRIHLAVAMGVAVATAVLTGALLVGDSVRGSLRDLTLQRLGQIDSALVAGHMFRAALSDELAGDAEFQKHFTAAEPAILLNGTVQAGSGSSARRATAISVVACRPDFWKLGHGGPPQPLADDELALTESIARELNVKPGDDVLLRIPGFGEIPADSSLGKKSDTSLGRTMKLATVLPDEGLSRFSLAPSQHLPRNVFVPLATMQELLKQPGKANAILVAENDADQAANDAAVAELRSALRPTLADYGLRVEHLTSPTDCFEISADQLVLSDEVVRAAEKAFPKTRLQPIVTYLANTLAAAAGNPKKKIPYSTITGVDSTAQLGPLLDEKRQPIVLEDDEIVLNRWAADDLGVKVGDRITVTFYEPESTHGRLHEHDPPPAFKLRAIVDLKTADGKPTPAADPKLTPDLPGVTDQKSISDWDLPFELVETIRPQDEDYWDQYRTAPKAFVSLATAERLWPSRWGTISLLRLHVGESLRVSQSRLGETRPRVAEQLQRELDPSELGMAFLPVKKLGLEASSGTTPFEWLFLGFSFFLIAAAVMLIALLFQLGVEQRAAELGTLAAVGVNRSRITRLLVREGIVVAAIGATFGVVAGVLYAWLMILGLRTWWLAAISTPFLRLHVRALSLLIGWIVGVVVSWLTVRWSIRRLVRTSTARLLTGTITGATTAAAAVPGSPDKPRRGFPRWPTFRAALALLTLALSITGFFLHGEAQAGIFFGSGATMLALLLGEIRHRLRNLARQVNDHGTFSLFTLSELNTARNPGRSTLTIGLVAAASFLIISVSAFRLDTGAGGTGGFDLIATSDQPIHYDLNTSEGRRELGVSDRPRTNEKISDEQLLSQWRIYSLRVAAGEDASCLNLYQATQPRVLGVPKSLVERGGFAWSETDKRFGDNPWAALDAAIGQGDSGEEVVPVVLDMSTAIYSLHLTGVGSRLAIRDGADRPVTLQVVGLLNNSVLQGNLLVNEANFLRLFPDTAGYRYFLIEESSRHAPRAATADGKRSVPAALESTLAEEGFDVVDAREQLAQFLAVQNTYLSTFQSLGALGLLLGTVGLAIVQLRSVLERRGELALMRAGGFSSGRLIRMVVWENALLLVGGLLVGGAAAAIALIPQWAPHGASVPWVTLGLLLGTIAVVGMLAGWLATRSALRAPIVGALRGD